MTQGESDLERRVIALEEAMMHNERLLAKLNEVVCEIQHRLDQQSRQFQTLQRTLDDVKNQEPEERSFEDERPPHY